MAAAPRPRSGPSSGAPALALPAWSGAPRRRVKHPAGDTSAEGGHRHDPDHFHGALRPSAAARYRRLGDGGPIPAGDRPKATVRDPQGRSWLVKRRTAADVSDIPALEHVTQQWRARSGLTFAATHRHAAGTPHSGVRQRRRSRAQPRGGLCASRAALAARARIRCASERGRDTAPVGDATVDGSFRHRTRGCVGGRASLCARGIVRVDGDTVTCALPP